MSRRDLLHAAHAYFLVAGWALGCSLAMVVLTAFDHAAAQNVILIFVGALLAPEIASWWVKRR